MKKVVNLYLISDSTGDTLSFVSKAVMSKFEEIDVRQYLWPLINTEKQLIGLFELVVKKNGIIMHTIANANLAKKLESMAVSSGILCVGVIDHITNAVSRHLSQLPSQGIGKQHIIDEEYLKRMRAISFSMEHDDGQHTEDIYDADVVIFGPSRTSKTPTSMYLAYKGYKVANIPFVQGGDFNFNFSKFTSSFLVGFTIDPEVLLEIRKHRELYLKSDIATSRGVNYADSEYVAEDVRSAVRFYKKNNIEVVDVTHKSIEEVSAKIIQLHHLWKTATTNTLE